MLKKLTTNRFGLTRGDLGPSVLESLICSNFALNLKVQHYDNPVAKYFNSYTLVDSIWDCSSPNSSTTFTEFCCSRLISLASHFSNLALNCFALAAFWAWNRHNLFTRNHESGRKQTSITSSGNFPLWSTSSSSSSSSYSDDSSSSLRASCLAGSGGGVKHFSGLGPTHNTN